MKIEKIIEQPVMKVLLPVVLVVLLCWILASLFQIGGSVPERKPKEIIYQRQVGTYSGYKVIEKTRYIPVETILDTIRENKAWSPVQYQRNFE